MGGDDRWKSLEVWQLGDALVLRLYEATRDFPQEEIYGLTAQLRRAALSVPTNIVEGYARGGTKELIRFLTISLGSLAETKYLLSVAERLGYGRAEELSNLAAEYDRLGQRLWRFYESVRKRPPSKTIGR
ncbi:MULTISPECIES: four helix bundle protein [Deferrisoma]